MPMPTISYKRAPSKGLQELLKPGRFLAPLVDLNKPRASGQEHDVHFRTGDEVHVYRGLTRVLTVKRLKSGAVKIPARDDAYKEQLQVGGLCRTWDTHEPEFQGILARYLDHVEVRSRHTDMEGAVQSQWSRVTKPWTPFDREAVLKVEPPRSQEKVIEFPEVKEAHARLVGIHEAHRTGPRRDRWTAPPTRRGQSELDQLAIDPEGRLVLLELKDGTKSSSEVYYAPFQLLQYVWEWHGALEAVRCDLQKLINARVELGLTPNVPDLTGTIRAAVGFGYDVPRGNTKLRYEKVLCIVNQHLPPDVPTIETWKHTDNGPEQVT